jgi:hypothetical protein
MDHIDDVLLLKASRGKVDEEVNVFIASHLSECDACLEKIRTFDFIRVHAENLLDSWTASEHGNVYTWWRLAEAALSLSQRSLSISNKLVASIANFRKSSLIVLHLLMDRAKKISCQASSFVSPLFNVCLEPAVAGVGGSEFVELERHRICGAEYLSQGRSEDAIASLEEGARIDHRAVTSSVVSVTGGKVEMLRIYTDAVKGKIWIKLWPVGNKDTFCWALLIPEEDVRAVRIVEFFRPEGEKFLLAEFENIETDLYEIFVQAE